MSTANVCVIQGRIDTIVKVKDRYYHDIQLPAGDAYAHPGWASVISDKPVGQVGQDVTVKAHMRGYRRKFNKRDGTEGTSISTVFDFVGGPPA